MEKKLTMDDVKKDMYITVYRGRMTQKMMPGFNGPETVFKENTSFNGAILKVIAVDLPYILIQSIENKIKLSIDLRTIEIMQFSNEYVKAWNSKLKLYKVEFDSDIELGKEILAPYKPQ